MSAIDISFWQGNPDFVQARNAGVSLVIMKCGSGEGARFSQDSVYAMNRAAARAAGMSVGSYFFNGPVDPIAAAEFQVSLIDWQPGDVVAIDVENSGNQPHWNPAQVLAWCQQILFHGIPADRILVYMSSSVLTAGWDAVVALGVGLWVAQYGPNDGNPHSAPNPSPWASWALWQYTSVGTLPGFRGHIDMNQIASNWASSGASILIPTILKADDDMAKNFHNADGTVFTVGETWGRIWTDPTDFSYLTNMALSPLVEVNMTLDQIKTAVGEANGRGTAYAAVAAGPGTSGGLTVAAVQAAAEAAVKAIFAQAAK